MNISDGEKLILKMLSEMYKHLDIKGEIDPEFVEETLYTGHTWGLHWKYPGIYQNEENPPEVKEVVNTLSMWSFLESSYERLSPRDKELVKINAAPFGEHVKFRGFDGNNECEYMSVASYLINHLDRFTEFKGRDLNAHCPSVDSYRRMYAVYDSIDGLYNKDLTAVEIIEILKAKIHPDQR